MLIDFTITNFKSFNGPQTLSMIVVGDNYNNAVQLDNIGGESFCLRTSAMLMGANSAGKSNFIEALSIMQFLLFHGIVQKEEVEEEQNAKFRFARFYRVKLYKPFYSNEYPTKFEIRFIVDGKKYRYIIAYDADKIHSECLYLEEKLVFKRNFKYIDQESGKHYYDYECTQQLMFDDESNVKVVDEVLAQYQLLSAHNNSFLLIAIRNGCYKLKHCYDFLVRKIIVIGTSESSTYEISKISRRGQYSFKELITNYLDIVPAQKAKLIELFKEIGADFDDIRINKDTKDIEVNHRVSDQDNWVSFYTQSLGTRRFAALLPLISHTIQTDEVLFIDELDSSLHHLLTVKIIEMFHNQTLQNHKAQIIFTAHDALLIDESLFKIDQMNFIQKQANKSSEIFKLSDFEDANNFSGIRQMYLAGKFQAIPTIKSSIMTDVIANIKLEVTTKQDEQDNNGRLF